MARIARAPIGSRCAFDLFQARLGGRLSKRPRLPSIGEDDDSGGRDRNRVLEMGGGLFVFGDDGPLVGEHFHVAPPAPKCVLTCASESGVARR